MSDSQFLDDSIDQDQLLAATSRASPNRDAQEQAAGLQEGFLALGRAVDEAQQQWCDEDLLARLHRAVPVVNPVVSPPRISAWQWLAAGVLAASALFATARVLMTSPADMPEIVSSHPDASTRAIVNDAPRLPDSEAADVFEGAWDDPLDAELASAATALDSYQATGANLDRSLADVDQQLDSLSADLAAGSL